MNEGSEPTARPANAAPPGTDPGADPAGPPELDADPAELERRRFREALERKKTGHAEHRNGHPDRGGRTPGSNDKHQRQFRRKSG